MPALSPLARRAIRVGVPVLVLALVLPPLLAAARRHPYFAIKQIHVQHHGRLRSDVVRAALGFAEGDGIWDADLAGAAARLRELPWVRSATVRRRLPDHVVVRVREHKPAAIVAVGAPNPGLFYVAASGRIFAPVGDADERDLPYVTGLTGDDLDGRDGFGPHAVHVALGLIRQVPRRLPALGALSEVHVDEEDGVTLIPAQPAVPVELGWGGFGGKLTRLARVLPLWAGRDGEMAGVSCVFEDSVIVRTRTARAVPAPKAASAGA